MDKDPWIKFALQIGDDWDIDWHEVNHAKHRIDLWLTPAGERHWLGGRRFKCTHCGHLIKLHDADRVRRWRHLNLGILATYLNVGVEHEFACPACGGAHHLVSWAEPGAEMTHELERRIAEAIQRLPRFADVCDLLSVTIDEVLAVHQKLGLKLGTHPEQTTPQEAAPQAGDSGWLPDDGHPAWLQLMEGRIDLKTDSLPLQFMLNRIKLQFDPAAAPEKHREQARLLRRYFLKYRQQSASELQQIFGHAKED